MKNIIILTILSLFIVSTFNVSAQNTAEEKKNSNPVFAEGKMSLNDFYKFYLTYPEKAASENITGKVEVEIVIDENGDVKKAHVTKSLSPETNKEALRIINLFPRFTPAKANGEAIASKIKIEVPFPMEKVTAGDAGSNEPLYVLDGKIVEGKISVEGDDIKSIRVLKGEKAIAKYGESGKNGVVIFTTK